MLKKIAIGIGALIILGIIASSGANQGEPTRTLTPAAAATNAPSSPTAAVTPAAEKQWVVVKEWSGDGIKDTEKFTVGGEWRIDWDFTPGQFGGVMQIYVYDDGGTLVGLAANTQKSGADSSFQHRAGTYYLTINSSGAWKVAIQDRR